MNGVQLEWIQIEWCWMDFDKKCNCSNNKLFLVTLFLVTALIINSSASMKSQTLSTHEESSPQSISREITEHLHFFKLFLFFF